MRAHARYLLLIMLALGIAVRCIAVHAAGDKRSARERFPKLIWERLFEGVVLDVGFDEDCFESSGGNADSCLKWVGLEVGCGEPQTIEVLRLFLGQNRVEQEIRVDTLAWHTFADGEYILITSELVTGGFTNRLLDWNGEEIWEYESSEQSDILVRTDRSAIVIGPVERFAGLFGIPYSAVFLDDHGKQVAEWDSIWCHSWDALSYDYSEGFFALSHIVWLSGGRKASSRLLFDAEGELVWQEDIPYRGRDGRVLITDSGLTLVQLSRYRTERKALLYGLDGASSDTLHLPERSVPSGVAGDMAFLKGDSTGVNRLFCYDLRNRQTRFVLDAERGRSFGGLETDLRRGLLAVVVGDEYVPEGTPWSKAVRVYSYEGVRLTEVVVEVMPAPRRSSLHIVSPPFRLLGDRLLVLDGKSLKLFDLRLD